MRLLGTCLLSVASLTTWAADAPAVMHWSQRVELSTPVSGVVQKVQVDVGDRVKAGQVLLTLDATSYQASVSQTQAVMARAQDEANDAKRNLERVQELYKRTVISTSELETAQTRQVRAQASVAEARAGLTRTQKALGDASLRAPFEALVVVRQVEPGQTVAAQFQPQTLIVLARANEMLARARVSLTQVEKLKIGDAINVQVGKETYNGKVKSLGLEPVGEKADAGYPVDVLFAVKTVLRAGTPATLKLP